MIPGRNNYVGKLANSFGVLFWGGGGGVGVFLYENKRRVVKHKNLLVQKVQP